jgi:lysozyme
MKHKISFKKILLYFALLLFFIIVISAVVIYYLNKQLQKKGEQTFYKSFEIAIPNQYSINGIDVSKHQSYVYWNAVKKMLIDNINIDFAFVKATEGINHTDEMFERNWKLLEENNIPHGAYLYFIPLNNGAAQAKNYIRTVSLKKGNLPPAVDIEKSFGLKKYEIKSALKECLDVLEKYYKVKPIIYTYTEFYNDYLGNDFNEYPLWVAHYTEEKKPNIKRDWTFWQHSNLGRVNGITEKVDFNVFNGDSIQFKKILLP